MEKIPGFHSSHDYTRDSCECWSDLLLYTCPHKQPFHLQKFSWAQIEQPILHQGKEGRWQIWANDGIGQDLKISLLYSS